VTSWAQTFFFGPKLCIVLRHDEYGKYKTVEQIHPERSVLHQEMGGGWPSKQVLSPEIRQDVMYLRLRVQNSGRGTAMRCRAFLADVSREETGGHLSRLFYDSIPLCWSYLDSKESQILDIPWGLDVYLDILSAHPGEPKAELRPRTIVMPFRYNQLFTEHGRYRVTIVVVAENAKAVTHHLSINWHGDLQSLDPKTLLHAGAT
jgi:hypothetical protein